LDLNLRGPVQYQSIFSNLSLNALAKNVRYVAFQGSNTIEYDGITLHNFPLNDDPVSFKAGLDQLINVHRIPANKLILNIEFFYFVHIINTNASISDTGFLGEPSTLLSEREDIPGSGVWTYSDVTVFNQR
jgi:hypothetical protein